VIHWRYDLSADISLKVDEFSTLKIVRSFSKQVEKDSRAQKA